MMALRTVGVRLVAEISGYRNELRAAAISTKEFASSLDKAAKAGKLDAVADQAARLGIGLGAAFGGVIAITAKFDKQMSEVGAVAGATGKDLDRLREAALQAGKDTSFSASEAAKAEAELAKAGLSTSDILGGALRGSLDLAAAGQLDLAEAADISAKAMNTFNLKGGDVGHIADVLAAAANKSATDVHEMGEALKMGGLAANAAGMSLDETVGTLAAFADRALVGSDAGTSFKTMLQMLAAPTDKAKTLMEELGISAYDASGNFIGTTKLAGQLQTALGDLTQEQRNAALATIFGADAMRAANVLFGLGEQGVQDYVKAVNDQGAASEVAAKKMDNLAGDIERLKGSLETLAIEAGSGSTGGLRKLVQTVDNLVGSLSAIPAPVQTAGVLIAGVGGAMALAAAGAIKLKAGMGKAAEQLGNIGPIGQRAASGLNRVAASTGKVAVALAAVQVASAAIGSSTNPQIELLAKNLADFGKNGKTAGEMTRLFHDDLGNLDYDLKSLADTGTWSSISRGTAGVVEGFTGLGNVADQSLQHSRERLQALDQALTQMVQSGHAADAKAAFDRIAAAAAANGVSVRELNNVLPGYAAAVEMAGTKAAGAAPGMDAAADGIGDVGGAADDAAKKVEDLKDAFDRLFGIKMDIERATLAYKQGIADLAKEFKGASDQIVENKKKSGEWNQVARDQRGAILDQIGAIKDLRDAEIEQTGDVDKGNAMYDKRLVALGEQLVAAGANKEAVWDLINAYRNVPKEAATEVKAKNAVPEKKKVEDFNFVIRKLPSGKIVTFTAKTAAAYDAAQKLKKDLQKIPDEVINIALRVTGSKNASEAAANIRKQYASAKGNVINTQTGLVEMAGGGIATAPTVLFGERSTGREMFLPQRGISEQRAMGLLQTGASWYGAQVVPQGEMPPVNVQVFVGDREITDIVDVRISENNRAIRRRTLAGAKR